MATAKQRAWRKKFGQMFGGRKRRSRTVTRTIRVRSRGTTMARRRFGRRSRRSGIGGLSFGRVLSVKNLAFTAGGSVLAPKVANVDPAIGGAVGGYAGAGLMGAIVGYFVGPMLNGFVGNMGKGSSSSGGYA